MRQRTNISALPQAYHPYQGQRRFAFMATAFAIAAASILSASPARPQEAESTATTLAKIAHELTLLEQEARAAARTQEQNSQTTFRFDWLSKDLATIRQGIEDHRDASRQPRRVSPPLRGDYRR